MSNSTEKIKPWGFFISCEFGGNKKKHLLLNYRYIYYWNE